MLKLAHFPPLLKKIIDHYLNLSLGIQKVPTPYYINEDHDQDYKKLHQVPKDIDRFSRRDKKNMSLIGKASPTEIEQTVYKYAKKHHLQLNSISKIQIRNFMEEHGIGIDCSGFVVWILNELFKEKYRKPIWELIEIKSGNLIRKLLVKLRPVSNISVRVLVNNSVPIQKVSDIRPGDLIITWEGQHVLLVSKVKYDQENNPIYFEYVNSTWWYGGSNGVGKGKVTITKQDGDLKSQDWDDFLPGKNWTYEGVKNKGTIFRLSALAD